MQAGYQYQPQHNLKRRLQQNSKSMPLLSSPPQQHPKQHLSQQLLLNRQLSKSCQTRACDTERKEEEQSCGCCLSVDKQTNLVIVQAEPVFDHDVTDALQFVN